MRREAAEASLVLQQPPILPEPPPIDELRETGQYFFNWIGR
jgi:hypothetical protein